MFCTSESERVPLFFGALSYFGLHEKTEFLLLSSLFAISVVSVCTCVFSSGMCSRWSGMWEVEGNGVIHGRANLYEDRWIEDRWKDERS